MGAFDFQKQAQQAKSAGESADTLGELLAVNRDLLSETKQTNLWLKRIAYGLEQRAGASMPDMSK